MKKLFIIILIIIGLFIFILPLMEIKNKTTEEASSKETTLDCFVLIEKDESKKQALYYHKDTKVIYFLYNNDVEILLNEDGTPMIYNENNK